MRGTTAPRLLLELVCARMLLPATDGSATATLQRLERLERRMSIAREQAVRLPEPETPVARAADPAPVEEPRTEAPPSPAGPRREFVRRSRQAAAPTAATPGPADAAPGVADHWPEPARPGSPAPVPQPPPPGVASAEPDIP